jgi:Mn2+/Fe2+ NRAMP family transporter
MEAEVFDWPAGLDRLRAQARGFYVVLALSLVGDGLISPWPELHPASAMSYSQVLDGVLLPVVMLLVLVLSNDRQIMGEPRTPAWVNGLAVLTIIVCLAAMCVALIGA